jgi:uncharacterized protein (DUF1778 family)
MLKTDRLDLRLTAEQKATIEQAALIEGATVSGYAVTAVMERATETIYRARALALPGPSWDEFVAVLETHPEAPAVISRLLSTPSVLET